jgi:hypothetical protein
MAHVVTKSITVEGERRMKVCTAMLWQSIFLKSAVI